MTILLLDYIFDHMQDFHRTGGVDKGKLETANEKTGAMSIGATRRSSSSSSSNSGSKMGKKPGKRPGRKPSKIDEHAKLERSRQSARECRARKKLRYQYLEELVLNREKAVFALKDELETYQMWCDHVDQGRVPDELRDKMAEEEAEAESAMLASHSKGHALSKNIVDFSSTFDDDDDDDDGNGDENGNT